jgi:hypothetical protein
MTPLTICVWWQSPDGQARVLHGRCQLSNLALKCWRSLSDVMHARQPGKERPALAAAQVVQAQAQGGSQVVVP